MLLLVLALNIRNRQCLTVTGGRKSVCSRDQFKSAEERDAFLRREVRHITRQIGDTDEQMKDIEKSLEDETREEEQLTLQVQVSLQTF